MQHEGLQILVLHTKLHWRICSCQLLSPSSVRILSLDLPSQHAAMRGMLQQNFSLAPVSWCMCMAGAQAGDDMPGPS